LRAGRRGSRLAGWLAVTAALAAGCTSAPPPERTPDTSPLVLGALVPHTGDLSAIGPAEEAGLRLALAEVSAAGGVLGKPVTLVEGDSGDAYNSLASQSVEQMIAARADAVVGATGSAVTMTVIDRIVGSGAVQVSPGDATDRLTGYPARGLFFRLVPPDSQAATVLARTIWRAGHRTLAVAVVRDVYGTGLEADLVRAFGALGGHVVLATQYDGQNPDVKGLAAQLTASNAEAYAVLGAGETRDLLEALRAARTGPTPVPLYVSDLAIGNALTKGLPTAEVAGITGVRPGWPPSADFLARLAHQSPGLLDVGYAAQMYDAVVAVALAADAAHRTDGRSIARSLPAIGSGRVACATYAACQSLLQEGRSIAYRGASGPVRLRSDGDPSTGVEGVYRVGPEGLVPPEAVAYVPVRVP